MKIINMYNHPLPSQSIGWTISAPSVSHQFFNPSNNPISTRISLCNKSLKSWCLLSGVLILFCSNGFGQVNYEQYYFSKREFGINATTLLANVFNLNPDNAGTPYSLYFRYRFGSTFVRTGLNFSHEKDEILDQINFNIIKINNNLIHLRSGLEWGNYLGGQFMMFYGVDFFGGLQKEESSSNFITSLEKTTYFGLGPALRFEYKLFKRLLISTESSLYGKFLKESNKTTGLDNITTTGFNVKVNLPTALFIGFQF